jgi:hypothetical protein
VRKLFEPKMQEVIGGWRKLCKEELNDYFVHINIYIVRVIKFKNMVWVRHVA